MIVVPRTAVITGPPGAGKTALLEELAARGFRTVAEAARAVLQGKGGMALRAQDPAGFARAMLQQELADLSAVPDDGLWTVFDRGLGDTLGFLRLIGERAGAEDCLPPLSCSYSGPVFLAPPWREIYRNDAERIQSWDEALASGAAVADAWRELGYDLVPLPLGGVGERADFVASRLGQ